MILVAGSANFWIVRAGKQDVEDGTDPPEVEHDEEDLAMMILIGGL